MILTETISAILQIAVFTLIPFVVFWITTKSIKGFGDYIGLKKSNAKANLLALGTSLLLVAGAVGLTLVSPETREVMLDPKTITGKFREMGFGIESVIVLLMIAVFKTAFAEEVLFRGFVAKRLIAWLGFQKGNLLQALIFGLIHLLLFLGMKANVFYMIFIFLLSGGAAYIMAYLNEKMANGSIIPGWIAHAMGNTVSYSVVGFLI